MCEKGRKHEKNKKLKKKKENEENKKWKKRTKNMIMGRGKRPQKRRTTPNTRPKNSATRTQQMRERCMRIDAHLTAGDGRPAPPTSRLPHGGAVRAVPVHRNPGGEPVFDVHELACGG